MLYAATLMLALSAVAAPAAEQPAPDQRAPDQGAPDALSSIESTRGGRHWADAKTDPPKSPEESRKCFQIDPGLRIELVACEPLVFDPVAIAFDHLGRMFAVEYADYPTGPPQPGPPLSRVVLLEDTDQDGRMDQRHVFADELDFAHSLMAYNDGLLVATQTSILFLRDTDGDQRSDVREVLFQGFTPAHPQMQIGCPRWGLDNWVYLNYGPGQITSSAAPDKPVEMPRLDFRFHPRTLQFGSDAGLGQFGNTIDNWGHRFYCTNRNPIIMTVLPLEVARRNPFAVIPQMATDVGPSGGDTLVYPLVQMKSNYLSHAGTHTSACGTTAYQGTLLGPAYENNVFVCEPVGHLVTRSVIKSQGPVLTAVRGRAKADFLASSDTWFRPASLATGPDGALYVADMYRLWVEHPKFLPEDIAQKLDWRAGEDRGRIWRILPAAATRRSYTPPQTTADLVALLSDDNGWCRHTAQRLLVERQSQDAVPALAELLSAGASGYSRLHALWTLEGLEALTLEHVVGALRDPEPHVRRDAVRLAARWLPERTSLLEPLAALAGDRDSAVRFEVTLALGGSDAARATEVLRRLAVSDGEDPWFVSALLTGCRDRSGQLLAAVVQAWAASPATAPGTTPAGEAASDERIPHRIRLVRELATVAGARGDVSELSDVMSTLAQHQGDAAWWQSAALSGLATGLARHRGELGRTSLAGLLANPPAELADRARPLQQLLANAQTIAVDGQRLLPDRLAAIELLGYRPYAQAAEAYDRLLSAGQPITIQLATLDAMRATGDDAAAGVVLNRWAELGPRARASGLELLLRKTTTTRLAMEGMAEGKISPAVLDIDQRVRLLRHGEPAIRDLAAKLFGGAISANRREVARQYESALSMEASVAEGAKVFERVCAKCHRVDGQGHVVGPDISDVRNRSRDALLYDILDPNLKIEPRFTDYTVVTDDGRVFNGLMDSETSEAVVLLQAEGKRQVIPRSQIEQLRASGKSLMPEGVEKEITVEQMAHLLEFLKARVPAAK